MEGFFKSLVRKKKLPAHEQEETSLNRCLTVFDLIFLGIGSTLGAGLYVVIGQVAKEVAGPAVVISFLVAAVASAFAGLCYAEFAARIPRAGSAYVYSYVTVGELMAFIIGWNLILEYIIGTASVARAFSSYFDNLIGRKMSRFFQDIAPMHISSLSRYPDFFALAITLLLTGLLIAGVKESARFNNTFTCVNLLVVIYVTVCGLFKADAHNWNISQDEVPENEGTGGFMPYGLSGVMAGAATCFYAFVGFDCVATTGEETKNPQRSTPIAVVVSLLVVFLSYFSVSTVVTLMCPYYLLDPDAALPAVFQRAGWGVARYLVAIGAMSALSTSLLGAMFPLPRILYAMGGDGVIFRFLGEINPRFQTPVLGTAISGLFAGVMAMIFDLAELVEMMSIGTLLAYTLVGVSVLILRYETDANLPGTSTHVRRIPGRATQATEPLVDGQAVSGFRFKHLFMPETREPTELTSRITKYAMAALALFLTVVCLLGIQEIHGLEQHQVWVVALTSVFGLAVIVCSLIIFLQPQNPAPLPFKVPLVPWIPILSAAINIYLMLKLSTMTWKRFGVWMAIGFLMYFGYGIRQAGRGRKSEREIIENSIGPTEPEDEPLLSPTSPVFGQPGRRGVIQ